VIKDCATFSAELEATYGPLMGGAALYRALGYDTYAAFRRCRAKGELGVRVFPIPARRGAYALTKDVAAWLYERAAIATQI